MKRRWRSTVHPSWRSHWPGDGDEVGQLAALFDHLPDGQALFAVVGLAGHAGSPHAKRAEAYAPALVL
ncbi:hypothetical protein TMRO357_01682 [Alteriqipengyuania sp. 357]